MSPKPRNRSHMIANEADFLFTVAILTSPSYEEQDDKIKKEKCGGPDDDRKKLLQQSPFEPKGRFQTTQTMDLLYTVEPCKQWLDMTRYNSFVLNGVKYCNEDFVYIANDTTIQRQKVTNKKPEPQELLPSTDYWVAKILEIRALDEHHVFARVYWMYSPDEIPANTLDGKRRVSGRQPYHRQNELIASNHMDIINVVRVAMPAQVNQWVESDDEQVQDALYWRQALDCRTTQLSSVNLTCKCNPPASPDKILVGSTNDECEQCLHDGCLVDDVLTRMNKELGTDEPHMSEESTVKLGSDEEAPAALLSTTPTESKGEEAKSPVGAKEGANGDTVPMKQIDGNTPRTTESPAPETPLPAAEQTSRLSLVKKGCPKAAEGKPYEDLGEATLKLAVDPTVLQIRDLRPSVSGGDRTSKGSHPISAPGAGLAQMPSTSKDLTNVLSTSQDLTFVPPLFPVYLPFKSQHELVVHLQKVLELATISGSERCPILCNIVDGIVPSR
ncbi:hypothetical protein FALCPG4_015441 [Fusarium falciforme]